MEGTLALSRKSLSNFSNGGVARLGFSSHAAHAFNSYRGIGPERRHGFQLRMGDAERCG